MLLFFWRKAPVSRLIYLGGNLVKPWFQRISSLCEPHKCDPLVLLSGYFFHISQTRKLVDQRRYGRLIPPNSLCNFIQRHFIPVFIQYGETVCLLSKLNAKQHIEVELNLDELDLTSAESKATYDEIKAYVLEKHGLKVSSLYISQVKRKCGLDVGQNYNLSKKEDTKVPQCPPEKEAAIMDALKHFQMI